MRIVLAGIVGGFVAFFCGAFNHLVLEWGGRAFTPVPDQAQIKAFFKEGQYQPLESTCFPTWTNPCPRTRFRRP